MTDPFLTTVAKSQVRDIFLLMQPTSVRIGDLVSIEGSNGVSVIEGFVTEINLADNTIKVRENVFANSQIEREYGTMPVTPGGDVELRGGYRIRLLARNPAPRTAKWDIGSPLGGSVRQTGFKFVP
jgi:hypothetical protein